MPMLQLILAMIIWGSLGLFVLKSGLSSIDIAFFRCLIGVMILIPFCAYRGYFDRSLLKIKTVLPVFAGGIFVVANWILLFESFHYASITLGNVSYYLQPVFLLFLGRIFFREPISSIKYFFVMLSLLGVLMTINLTPEMLQFKKTELLGIFFALAAGFLYSLATIIAKKSAAMPAPLMTCLQLGIGAIVLLPMSHLTTLTFTGSTLGYILILGLVHTVLAFVLYYHSVSKLPTDQIAVLSYVDPIAAIFTDVLFFNRVLVPVQIIGIILTMVSSYFVINAKGLTRWLSQIPLFKNSSKISS